MNRLRVGRRVQKHELARDSRRVVRVIQQIEGVMMQTDTWVDVTMIAARNSIQEERDGTSGSICARNSARLRVLLEPTHSAKPRGLICQDSSLDASRPVTTIRTT